MTIVVSSSKQEKVFDDKDLIIGYEFINFGRMMDMIKAGTEPKEAMEKATGRYGRFDDAVKYIDPRKE